MAEDGNNPAAPEFGDAGGATDDADECPYGHKGWVFQDQSGRKKCARCGVRIIKFPGVALG